MKFRKIFEYHESTPIDTKGVSAKRNPFNPRNLRSNSAHAEADVADDLCAEALFWFSQDVDLGSLLEFIVQNGLDHADVENTVTQREGRRCAAMNSLLRNFAHSWTLGARIAANESERRGKRPSGQVCKRVPPRP